jgi:hypothetical protein
MAFRSNECEIRLAHRTAAEPRVPQLSLVACLGLDALRPEHGFRAAGVVRGRLIVGFEFVAAKVFDFELRSVLLIQRLKIKRIKN